MEAAGNGSLGTSSVHHPDDSHCETAMRDSTTRRLSIACDASLDGLSVQQVAMRVFHLTQHQVSRAKFQDAGIMLDGTRAFSTQKVHTGQTLSIVVGDSEAALASAHVKPGDGDPTDATCTATSTELRIAYEDEDVLIVDKPAGITMYPGPGHFDDTLGNLVLSHLAAEGVHAVLHPVNRLDKGTSGLVVFSTNAHAQDRLQRALHSPDFRRIYLAICCGRPDPARGTIEAAINRSGLDTYHVDASGKPARTTYETLATWEDEASHGPLSLVRLELATGRTHQIRVHMAHIGCTLLGDTTYGSADPRILRPALHSAHLELVHPVTGKRLVLDSPIPDDMMALFSTEPTSDLDLIAIVG